MRAVHSIIVFKTCEQLDYETWCKQVCVSSDFVLKNYQIRMIYNLRLMERKMCFTWCYTVVSQAQNDIENVSESDGGKTLKQ